MTPRRQTQLNIVKNYLKVKGSISRNYCLSIYISRLGAYVNQLNSEGWEIEGRKVENDYVYTLKNQPKVPEVKIIERIDSSGKVTRVATYI